MNIELNDEPGRCISSRDLAVLADWASKQSYLNRDHDFARAFALLREGSDLLLRRRARAEEYKERKNGQ